VVDHIDGYDDLIGPCMPTDDALLAWSKNPKQFRKDGDRWERMITELFNHGLYAYYFYYSSFRTNDSGETNYAI
jgi:hypothetical protein